VVRCSRFRGLNVSCRTDGRHSPSIYQGMVVDHACRWAFRPNGALPARQPSPTAIYLKRCARRFVMVRLLWIVIYLVSLAIALMCALAAITILAAVVTGKLADPEAWQTAVFLAAVGCLLWFLCRAAWRLSE